jgi:flagellar basal-body rod protein FlgF
MTDRALFLGMTGAKDAMAQLNLVANNIANANTVGFRSDFALMKTIGTQNDKMDTRQFTQMARTYSDFKQGPLISTGRELDVAIDGPGFIAVQTKEGKEAYTRSGNLEINPKGLLVTNKGDLVLGQRGVISIPRAQKINIDKSGIVSAQLPGEAATEMVNLNTIKLVHAPLANLQKGEDGLFYMAGEGSVVRSDDIKLLPETLEGSNVDTVKEMVNLIDLSRNFEIHTRMMRTMEENATRSNQTLNITE